MKRAGGNVELFERRENTPIVFSPCFGGEVAMPPLRNDRVIDGVRFFQLFREFIRVCGNIDRLVARAMEDVVGDFRHGRDEVERRMCFERGVEIRAIVKRAIQRVRQVGAFREVERQIANGAICHDRNDVMRGVTGKDKAAQPAHATAGRANTHVFEGVVRGEYVEDFIRDFPRLFVHPCPRI